MSALIPVAAAVSVLIATARERDRRDSEPPARSVGSGHQPHVRGRGRGGPGGRPLRRVGLPSQRVHGLRNENIVKIDAAEQSGFDFIRVELNGPGCVPLGVGRYPDARSRDSAPDSAGMLAISNASAMAPSTATRELGGAGWTRCKVPSSTSGSCVFDAEMIDCSTRAGRPATVRAQDLAPAVLDVVRRTAALSDDAAVRHD